jgi:predicted ATPase
LPEYLALPPPNRVAESWQRHRLFEALSRAILTTPQLLLLVIDDLQWCDQETLEWLHFLLRYDPQAQLLIVGTARAEEIDLHPPLKPLLYALRTSHQLDEIKLTLFDTRARLQPVA